jgi:uncharacterized protein (DUF983 family)
VGLDQPSNWACPSCQHLLPFDRADPALPQCQVCGNRELYKKKDFPHWLAMIILVGGCALSFYTHYAYANWYTWAILFGSAAIDGVLYVLVGDALVCYRCNAHYKGFQASPAHQPFELTIAERYRQERLRREQMKMQP